MEIRPEELRTGDVHKLIIGCVVPRPIAWVATLSAKGVRNLAPFSYFSGISSRPAAVCISCSYQPIGDRKQKDTLRNILETDEFVINVVTEATMQAMHQSSVVYPSNVDEFAEVGVTPTDSVTVRPPRVAESPIGLECRLHTTVSMGEGPGSATLVIGVVQHIHVDDSLINDQLHVDLHRLEAVGRLAGRGTYCRVQDIFDLQASPYRPV